MSPPFNELARVQEFISFAHKLGVGFEAAFIISLNVRGSELFKYARDNLFIDLEDDLSVACRLCDFYQTGEVFDENMPEMEQLFDDVFVCARSLMESTKLPYHNLYNLGSNYPSVDNFNVHHFIYHVQIDLKWIQPAKSLKSVRSALAHSLCSIYGKDKALTFFRDEIFSSLNFYNRYYKCVVTIDQESVIHHSEYFKTQNFGRAIAFELLPDKKAAAFICDIPYTHRSLVPFYKISIFQLDLGSAVVTDLIKSGGKDEVSFNRITKEMLFVNNFQSYRPGDSYLTLIGTHVGKNELLEWAKNRVKSIADTEINWNVFRCLFEETCALVYFGPGFKIRSIERDDSSGNFTLCVYCDKNKNDSSFLSNIENFLNDYCLTIFEYEPLIFIFDDNLYIVLNSQKDFENVLVQLTRSILKGEGFKVIKNGLFEYLLSSSLHDSNKNNIYPGTCTICLNYFEGNNCIKLSLCGHFYCDTCLLQLIENSTTFPLRCAHQHCQFLAINDIRKVFGRKFTKIQDLKTFILPLLQRSLYSFVNNNDEFVWCKTTGCHYLIKVNINCQTIICPKCRNERCGGCGEDVHEGKNCEEARHALLLKDDHLLLKWKEEISEMCRFCPNKNCNMLIERTIEGCNHMECTNCKTHFCWICESFKSDNSRDIYRHMLEIHGSYGVDYAHLNMGNYWVPFDYYEDVEQPLPIMNQRLSREGLYGQLRSDYTGMELF
uniref:RBR-type E3 ubiquitin transferase n=1 Tax=Meloidogyne incognita TaxID=6306 RepID=A0A914L839_MELIC